jgi:hypothetical protein
LKTKRKIVLALLIALISLVVLVNIPIINTGIIASGCTSFTHCTPPHPVYESLFEEYLPCTFSVCSVPPQVVTLEFANLDSGSATNQSYRGTASVAAAFNNPASATKLSSYELWSPGNASMTMYECTSSSSCTPLGNAPILANSVTYFNDSTVLYLSNKIVLNETYNYIFNFANGQSVSGTLNAS